MAHGGEALNAGAGAEADAARAAQERREFGRWLFAQDCRFVAGAASGDAVPAATLPEIAFAGRSNVGKSSLVNALTGRKTLARVSITPGRTRQLNFFLLGERLMLVDLPGYGYASASKSDIKAWTGLTRDYLRGRPGLRRVLLLVDSRHGLKEPDREMMKMLDEAAVSYQIVLTKSDKPKGPELARVRAAVAEEAARHVAAHPELVATSAVTGAGVEELRAELAGFAAGE
ncbi:MAG TPA: ribosome biogenesis GTP-binding protein YihA/YsxC [Alphaproteobacteria bacterium]